MRETNELELRGENEFNHVLIERQYLVAKIKSLWKIKIS